MSGSGFEKSGETEAIVLVKAAPQVGAVHGETVCCAAVDLNGNWLRLYPIQYRYLEGRQKFARWDRIRFQWRLPKNDSRPESRRVEQDSLAIVGKLKENERQRFVSNLIVTDLKAERARGRSLALLKPQVSDFVIKAKPPVILERERRDFQSAQKQADLFRDKNPVIYMPAPYWFRYRYRSDDGPHIGTCQDWEIDATYFKWSRKYGEKDALRRMEKTFGQQFIEKGMLLAMGTHSVYRDKWLINGVIRMDELAQLSLF